ncbi:MAG: prepilin-type N-terminal cleavage/methylation domain-containing protein, partial [Magnetococcales bacterium]|nr:prepilin-type N-terminal cleavage/methylation domain-containing protein [Magnetococcales bacterium]
MPNLDKNKRIGRFSRRYAIFERMFVYFASLGSHIRIGILPVFVRSQTGYTLVELLITLAIALIVS